MLIIFRWDRIHSRNHDLLSRSSLLEKARFTASIRVLFHPQNFALIYHFIALVSRVSHFKIRLLSRENQVTLNSRPFSPNLSDLSSFGSTLQLDSKLIRVELNASSPRIKHSRFYVLFPYFNRSRRFISKRLGLH